MSGTFWTEFKVRRSFGRGSPYRRKGNKQCRIVNVKDDLTYRELHWCYTSLTLCERVTYVDYLKSHQFVERTPACRVIVVQSRIWENLIKSTETVPRGGVCLRIVLSLVWNNIDTQVTGQKGWFVIRRFRLRYDRTNKNTGSENRYADLTRPLPLDTYEQLPERPLLRGSKQRSRLKDCSWLE